ncbi:hypothetical protein D9758_012381 [Tetrapyrgos nigripes]|uniref:Helitron helicase-like domain-containing protein n=1 Tax=Tetrapyrgos nigripes TaxID=182062 RepID=A0A8H5D8Z4_9AGAR|nr:hypothetical protein D9758_012381 [Tetrapyrgos nigripes]
MLALNWLVINHPDYSDVVISQENMDQYEEHCPPCTIEYKEAETNKTPESTSVYDVDDEDGLEGDCAFTVHGMTGEKLHNMTASQLRAKAWEHFDSGGAALAVGHSDAPESIYNNPQLYPKMFPWLFPYGSGGIGSTHLSESRHKKWLLMYHDKRFQTEPNFPFVAFSHSQIKATTTSAFLMAERRSFPEITQRLLSLDKNVMASIAQRMAKNEKVMPQSDQEKACFQFLNDIDHVAGRVEGSTTTKKNMRHEIWSLISHLGAPSWYITLSPADERHPISLYFAGTDEISRPEIVNEAGRMKALIQNPVAAARFFHFMVEAFLDCILGRGSDERGLYGDLAAHYGTVEQQGRLTLHLHLMLWLKGCLSPQDVRDKMLNTQTDFAAKIIQYFESVYSGDYFENEPSTFSVKEAAAKSSHNYTDPTKMVDDVPLRANCYRFHPSHPLYSSHGIRLRKESDFHVANFLGANLPRRDEGDYQYYCSTMLTFFKPWRTGLDLRTSDSTWDEAFRKYNFTARQQELMNNFNIIYECLDARDDYRAQLKAGLTPTNSWEEPFMESDQHTDSIKQVFADAEILNDADLQDEKKFGSHFLKRQRDIQAMRDIMAATKWSEPSQTKAINATQFEQPSCKLSGGEWKQRVLEKRQQFINRFQTPTEKNECSNDFDNCNFTYDKVHIIDKSYLEKSFDSRNNKNLIDHCISKFTLNEEQEKAFKIIANHATCSSPQQLQMYIGGMGGTGKSRVIEAVSYFFLT